MSTDDHVLIENALKYSDMEGEERMAMLERVAVQVALYAPEARVQFLKELDNAIEAGDGSTLRSKAQILSLKRSVEDSHRKLRLAGR